VSLLDFLFRKKVEPIPPQPVSLRNPANVVSITDSEVILSLGIGGDVVVPYSGDVDSALVGTRATYTEQVGARGGSYVQRVDFADGNYVEARERFNLPQPVSAERIHWHPFGLDLMETRNPETIIAKPYLWRWDTAMVA